MTLRNLIIAYLKLKEFILYSWEIKINYKLYFLMLKLLNLELVYVV